MKTALRDWDALVSIGGMRDSFEIDNRMWNLNSKCLLKILKLGIGIKILKVAGWGI